jgi:hypothetical protein
MVLHGSRRPSAPSHSPLSITCSRNHPSYKVSPIYQLSLAAYLLTQTDLPFIRSIEVTFATLKMEEEKPLVQVILPSHANHQNTEELSRPPSAFPVEEAERLRAQEDAGERANDEVSPESTGQCICY